MRWLRGIGRKRKKWMIIGEMEEAQKKGIHSVQKAVSI